MAAKYLAQALCTQLTSLDLVLFVFICIILSKSIHFFHASKKNMKTRVSVILTVLLQNNIICLDKCSVINWKN